MYVCWLPSQNLPFYVSKCSYCGCVIPKLSQIVVLEQLKAKYYAYVVWIVNNNDSKWINWILSYACTRKMLSKTV